MANGVKIKGIHYVLTNYNKNGTMGNSVLTAYVIDDGQRNTLLIDEIK